MVSLRGLRLVTLLGCALLFANTGHAGEKKFMHCSFFTPMAQAFEADWDEFYKATDELPGKIPGLSRIWAGKLRKPSAGHEYGVCMELDSAEAFQQYAEHPAHLEWVSIYSRVLKPVRTQFDIIGR
jgi:hypothetical protein